MFVEPFVLFNFGQVPTTLPGAGTGNGLSFHRIDRAKDPNFWSVRVNADLRLIVHRAGGGG